MPFTLTIGVGVAAFLALVFAGFVFWIIRYHILHKRGGKTARIITANQRAKHSIDMSCGKINTKIDI